MDRRAWTWQALAMLRDILILCALPAAKSALGPNLQFTVKRLRRYEAFAADVKERLKDEE